MVDVFRGICVAPAQGAPREEHDPMNGTKDLGSELWEQWFVFVQRLKLRLARV